MSDIDSPKEIIAIATNSKWESIKGFLRTIIQKTLDKRIGYDVVIIKSDAKSSDKKESNFTIKKVDHFKKLDQISEFDHISLYQSNGYINNHINLTKENDVIIVLAKYMGPEIDHAGKFDFSVYLNSLDNPYFTISDQKEKLTSQDLLMIFNNGLLEYKKPDIKDIPDEKLEEFIFESVSGKNAVWGGSETKRYKKWKEECSSLFRNKTDKNPYYGGSITRRYREFLVKMYNLWYIVHNKLENSSDSSELKKLESFLSTF